MERIEVSQVSKTKTKEEAWDRHERSTIIKRLLACFRDTAERMIKEGFSPLITRDVRKQMVEDGTYVDVGSDRWMGSAFCRDSRFVSAPGRGERLTPEKYTESNKQTGRSTHGAATIFATQWTLRETA